jgi:hypothetical protein
MNVQLTNTVGTMKSLKISPLVFILAVVVVSSCNPLNKMKKNAGNVK